MAKCHALTPGAKFGMRPARIRHQQQPQQQQQQEQEGDQQQQPQQQEEQEDDQQQPMFSLTDLLSVVRTIADAATFSFSSEPQLEERMSVDALTLSAAAPLPEAVPVPEAFDESAYIEV